MSDLDLPRLPRVDVLRLISRASETATPIQVRDALRCMTAALAAEDPHIQDAFMTAALAILCGTLTREEIMDTDGLREFALLACRRAMAGLTEPLPGAPVIQPKTGEKQ